MTRFTRSSNGKYVVKGKSFDILIGTRAQVWHGTAYKTAGGLTRAHIMQNKSGRIVSKSKHASAKKENRLVKAGYGTKKGKFGFVKLNKTKGKRGGSGMTKPTMGSNSSNNGSNSNSSNSNSNSSNSNSGSSNNMMKAAVLSEVMGNKSGGRRRSRGQRSHGQRSHGRRGGSSSNFTKPTMGSTSNSSNSSNSGSNSSNSGSSSSNNMMKAAVLSKAMGNTTGGRRSRRRRGGMYALSPTPYDGQGVGTSGVNLQFVAGNATS